MTDQTLVNDPWEIADNAKPREFEYYGLVKADVWFGFFPGGGQKPVPFDPQQHPVEKRVVMIDIQIIPIVDQNITFDVKQNYTDFSLDWTKVTLPSIKALGLDGLRSLNGKFARVTLVDGKREKKDEDGNKTGEFYKTFKFLQVFADEQACRQAYSGASPAHTEPEQPTSNGNGNGAVSADKMTALSFAKVIVTNAAKDQKDLNVIRETIATNFANYPLINQHLTVDSPEVMTMIMEAMK
jgi:hypothetical protein